MKRLVLLFCLAAASFGGAATPSPASADFRQLDLFRAGEGGYHTYRIPALIESRKGTLLAFCEGRKNSDSDRGDIDLLLRRSYACFSLRWLAAGLKE